MPLVRAGNLGGVGGDMRPELDERAQHGTSFAAHSGEGVGEEAGNGAERREDGEGEGGDGVLRVVLVSLEYRAGTFSGNGVYAQSLVRSLMALGHRVMVVSAAPPPCAPAPSGTSPCSSAPIVLRLRHQPSQSDGSAEGRGVEVVHEPSQGEECVAEVPVDAWGRLDWRCCWQQWATRLAGEQGGAQVAARVARFAPQWMLVVDWSAVAAYHAIAGAPVWGGGKGTDGRGSSDGGGASSKCADQQGHEHPVQQPPGRPRMAYLNFRVYSLSQYQAGGQGGGGGASQGGGAGDGGGERQAEKEKGGAEEEEAERERAFYREKESEAVAMADVVTALSTRDARYLASSLGAGRKVGGQPRALLPPLREDIRVLAVGREVATSSWRASRTYVTCCVRLSPEKNAALLPALLRLLAPHLPALGVTPLVCTGTSATRGAFGEAVLAEVVSAAPAAVVVDGFMGAERMAHVYSQTLLNIHPCLYDAYGMTVVEAAAFAAPSIIHVGPGGAVGAAELLLPGEQLALPLDLSAALPVVVEGILALLQDRQYLAQVGVAARRRSLEWSEEASARVLSAILRGGPA
ncbi:hypothetical protein CLOP_g22394 [Closterium sp. NIES-67]|nr:hypothetical protein CLOP_g22394 [Closterium sp. NIES-67]